MAEQEEAAEDGAVCKAGTADKWVEVAAGEVPGILLFGALSAGPMVGAGVLATWTGWVVLVPGRSPMGGEMYSIIEGVRCSIYHVQTQNNVQIFQIC